MARASVLETEPPKALAAAWHSEVRAAAADHDVFPSIGGAAVGALTEYLLFLEVNFCFFNFLRPCRRKSAPNKERI